MKIHSQGQAKMIRVILAGPYPHPGGMKGTFGRILDNLADSPVFNQKVCFIPQSLTLPEDGGFMKRALVEAKRSLRSMVRNADFIHVVMQHERSLYREHPLLRFGKLFGMKTIMDVRTGKLQQRLDVDNNKIQNRMMKNLFSMCDAILVECCSDAELIMDRYGRKAIHIPNVVLKSKFNMIRPADLPPRPGKPLRIVYSGRYIREKGLLEVLSAAEILSRRGRSIELHLTGDGVDREISDTISRYINHPLPGLRVVDHGWDVPDLLALLASMHVFILATTYPNEGHPSSLTEGMTAGLGLVLSHWKHIDSLIPQGGAVFIDPKDPNDISRGIEYYLDHPEALKRAGELNRKHVAENFLDTVAYPKLLELYQSQK
jgi:glycosyltransferase involved in cell wall biosynthesis